MAKKKEFTKVILDDHQLYRAAWNYLIEVQEQVQKEAIKGNYETFEGYKVDEDKEVLRVIRDVCNHIIDRKD